MCFPVAAVPVFFPTVCIYLLWLLGLSMTHNSSSWGLAQIAVGRRGKSLPCDPWSE